MAFSSNAVREYLFDRVSIHGAAGRGYGQGASQSVRVSGSPLNLHQSLFLRARITNEQFHCRRRVLAYVVVVVIVVVAAHCTAPSAIVQVRSTAS
ncbi:hypothetical protein V3C99_018783 [Haemonchus contortus]|uniref:Uncharacterized protein n=1 Tax=Haemonchus placei TaxID=6290 RepID=A0A0N4WGX6_HAEPC|nr:unnamed protein product [Haemonchus placei]